MPSVSELRKRFDKKPDGSFVPPTPVTTPVGSLNVPKQHTSHQPYRRLAHRQHELLAPQQRERGDHRHHHHHRAHHTASGHHHVDTHRHHHTDTHRHHHTDMHRRHSHHGVHATTTDRLPGRGDGFEERVTRSWYSPTDSESIRSYASSLNPASSDDGDSDEVHHDSSSSDDEVGGVEVMRGNTYQAADDDDHAHGEQSSSDDGDDPHPASNDDEPLSEDHEHAPTDGTHRGDGSDDDSHPVDHEDEDAEVGQGEHEEVGQDDHEEVGHDEHDDDAKDNDDDDDEPATENPRVSENEPSDTGTSVNIQDEDDATVVVEPVEVIEPVAQVAPMESPGKNKHGKAKKAKKKSPAKKATKSKVQPKSQAPEILVAGEDSILEEEDEGLVLKMLKFIFPPILLLPAFFLVRWLFVYPAQACGRFIKRGVDKVSPFAGRVFVFMAALPRKSARESARLAKAGYHNGVRGCKAVYRFLLRLLYSPIPVLSAMVKGLWKGLVSMSRGSVRGVLGLVRLMASAVFGFGRMIKGMFKRKKKKGPGAVRRMLNSLMANSKTFVRDYKEDFLDLLAAGVGLGLLFVFTLVVVIPVLGTAGVVNYWTLNLVGLGNLYADLGVVAKPGIVARLVFG